MVKGCYPTFDSEIISGIKIHIMFPKHLTSAYIQGIKIHIMFLKHLTSAYIQGLVSLLI